MMMKLFEPIAEKLRARYAELYAFYELAYTIVDFVSAALFVIGSVLFFHESWVTLGIWMYLLGSIGFGLKPTIRLVREIHFWRKGEVGPLASSAERED